MSCSCLIYPITYLYNSQIFVICLFADLSNVKALFFHFRGDIETHARGSPNNSDDYESP